MFSSASKSFFVICVLTLVTKSLAADGEPIELSCLYEPKLDGTLTYISGEQYACTLQADFPSLDDVAVVPKGNHTGTKDDPDVTALLIDDRKIFQVPKVKTKFTALKYIKITKTPLRYLRKENLAEYKEVLEHLIIQDSEIEVIEEEMFVGFLKIITIDLQNNKIFYIADGVFGPTTLVNLMLEGNGCLDDSQTPEDIGNCQDTNDLANYKTKIGTSTCKAQALSIVVFLEHQETKAELELNIYEEDQKYKKLDADYKEVGTNYTNLKTDYKTAENKITALETQNTNLASKIEDLESQAEKCLDVEGTCRFTTDDTYGYSCIAHNINVNSTGQEITWNGTHNPTTLGNKNVFGLILRDLVVQYVPKSIGIDFINLKTLIIRNCGLKKLTKNDFVTTTKLENIQIIGNEITSIDSGVFDDLELLKNLDLSENKIKSLPSKIFAQLKVLTSLNLNKNELTAVKSDFLSATNAIVSFTAKDNQFTMVESAFVWRLRSATLIDFSGNGCNQKFDKDTDADYIKFYNLILMKC